MQMQASSMTPEDWIVPDWPAPPAVQAVVTSRHGGVSRGTYASMNPADHVGDDPAAVAANRQRLEQRLRLPAAPAWLQQVHGTRVVDAASVHGNEQADAAWTCQPGIVCAVLTADCLPLLLCDRAGCCVAAAHAGWRGLAAGVIEQTVAAMGLPGSELLAWLGPAIGPAAYQVGSEVRDSFMAHDPQAAAAFSRGPEGSWWADLYCLARQRLADCGVHAVSGGEHCTYTESERFFSYRRDGVTGRIASLIWLGE
jgi:YfiH family protein